MLSESIVESLPGGEKIAFMYIPPGTFLMGSPDVDEDAYDSEKPQHEVSISKGFYLGKYVVTQGLWEGVMGTCPWSGKDYVRAHSDYPAVCVSWEDTQAFIGKLNEGRELYRLPSEAEWEYGCRAGASSRWSFGDGERNIGVYAWYDDNAWEEQYAHKVGEKRSNDWGLYDMHGNVYEWCGDWYGAYASGSQVDPVGSSSGSSRVLRGGAFHDYAEYARSGYRNKGTPSHRLCYFGFRLLRMFE